jgi:hypothetical protein
MTALSLTQLEVIEQLTEPGSPGVLERWTGGFWTLPGMARESHGWPVWSTTVQTVQAMERKGLLRRTYRYPEEWRDDRELTKAWLDLGLGGHVRNEDDGACRVPVTARERDHAAWALDAMADLIGDPDWGYTAADLPTITESTLVFPNAVMVEDMLYRLEEQLPDMAMQMDKPRSAYAAALSLAAKIRQACGDLQPNKKSASVLEAERAQARGIRQTAKEKIRRLRAQLATLEAEKRAELSRINTFASAARGGDWRSEDFRGGARVSGALLPLANKEDEQFRHDIAREHTGSAYVVFKINNLSVGDRGDDLDMLIGRCRDMTTDKRYFEIRSTATGLPVWRSEHFWLSVASGNAVDAFYDAMRRQLSASIEEREAFLREDIDRTRDVTAIQTKSGRKAASALRYVKKREAEAESDDAVEQNIDSGLLLVWRAVKRHITGSSKMDRTEAFEHWVEENPEEVIAILAEKLEPDEAELQRAEAEHYAERAAAAASDDEIPF